MKVLGIDYSLNGTGLVVYNGKKIVFHKVFSTLKKHQNLKHFIFVPKMSDTMHKIDIISDLIINCTKYDYVCMEDHIGRYYDWMDGYGIIKYLLRQNKKPYLMVSPTMVKKYAGNGKADKNMMSYFLKKDYQFDFDYLGPLSNNIVDAAWMAILGYNYINHKIDTPARNIILQKLRDKEK